ncbi:MAG TPA: hypothetical protein P5075_11895 [Eubacteriales bacterium]|nr:hypothetical protein [Eubacteriales bacterium]
MEQPLNYAMIENGVVVNVMWLCPANAADFPDAVCVGDRLVAAGDAYTDGVFTRGGAIVPTEAERIAALEAEAEQSGETV